MESDCCCPLTCLFSTANIREGECIRFDPVAYELSLHNKELEKAGTTEREETTEPDQGELDDDITNDKELDFENGQGEINAVDTDDDQDGSHSKTSQSEIDSVSQMLKKGRGSIYSGTVV